MPSTHHGSATCRTGGEYRFVQLCVGAPRCHFNEDARKFTQAQPKGCGMCRREYVYVASGDKMPVIEPPPLTAATPKIELSLRRGNLTYFVETRRIACGDATTTVSPAIGRAVALMMRSSTPVPEKQMKMTLAESSGLVSEKTLATQMWRLRNKLTELGWTVRCKKRDAAKIYEYELAMLDSRADRT